MVTSTGMKVRIAARHADFYHEADARAPVTLCSLPVSVLGSKFLTGDMRLCPRCDAEARKGK